jgi:hypothetical protein
LSSTVVMVAVEILESVAICSGDKDIERTGSGRESWRAHLARKGVAVKGAAINPAYRW